MHVEFDMTKRKRDNVIVCLKNGVLGKKTHNIRHVKKTAFFFLHIHPLKLHFEIKIKNKHNINPSQFKKLNGAFNTHSSFRNMLRLVMSCKHVIH